MAKEIRLLLDQGLPRDAAAILLDADFHALLATSMASTPSVIRLRLQGLDGAGVAGHVATVGARFAAELAVGCLVSRTRRHATAFRSVMAIESGPPSGIAVAKLEARRTRCCCEAHMLVGAPVQLRVWSLQFMRIGLWHIKCHRYSPR